ncbi:S-adenosyl-L-methionine-dependent methyltransferase [Halenospora varia]|nr:S-adenosyl-L-methionine-dependent methyltransferase [Halenospora varia]
MNTSTFVPKQAITKDVDLYAEITQNSTKDVAKALFSFIPPIPSQSTIHDNGCGAGEVTRTLLEANPSLAKTITIQATDIDQSYLDRFQSLANENNWPVHISNMPAESLTFADETFDISIANFVIFLTPPDGIAAVQHMYRTLKSGGTAIFTAWKRLPHIDPVNVSHLATRGANGPPLREIPPQWWRGEHLVDVAIKAGFARENVRLEEVRVWIEVKDTAHLAQVLWSYLGVPVTGWMMEDEGRWDKAIGVILESFGKTQGFKETENGGMKIELTANVVIAVK